MDIRNVLNIQIGYRYRF